MTYPGGNAIGYAYDSLNRVSTIADGGDMRAVYLYLGPPFEGLRAALSTVEGPQQRSRVALRHGAATLSTLKLSYDGLGRVTSHLYRNAADDATIVGFEHGYDKIGNPQYEVRVHQSNEGDEYTYDALHRITRAVYDDATPTTPTANPADADKEGFLYDLIGNGRRAPRTPCVARSPRDADCCGDEYYEASRRAESRSVGIVRPCPHIARERDLSVGNSHEIGCGLQQLSPCSGPLEKVPSVLWSG